MGGACQRCKSECRIGSGRCRMFSIRFLGDCDLRDCQSVHSRVIISVWSSVAGWAAGAENCLIWIQLMKVTLRCSSHLALLHASDSTDQMVPCECRKCPSCLSLYRVCTVLRC